MSNNTGASQETDKRENAAKAREELSDPRLVMVSFTP